MAASHQGSCHCGRVAFEVYGEIDSVLVCNCSLCSLKGALWHGTDDKHFKIISGEDELLLYQFGTMTARHYSCMHCGVSTFSHPRIAPTAWVVNVRCLQGVDPSQLTVDRFDGQNWEVAAQRFMRKRAPGDV